MDAGSSRVGRTLIGMVGAAFVLIFGAAALSVASIDSDAGSLPWGVDAHCHWIGDPDELKRPADVGGELDERSFGAAGYLRWQHDGRVDVSCGQTLVQPKAALTALHCVERFEERIARGEVLLVGFGPAPQLGAGISARERRVVEVVACPDGKTDLALLVLDSEVLDVPPARLGAAPPLRRCKGAGGEGPLLESFGYHRQPGAHLRKRVDHCVDARASGDLTLLGLNGGSCFGDSGSGVRVAGTDQLAGVLIGTQVAQANVPMRLGADGRTIQVCGVTCDRSKPSTIVDVEPHLKWIRAALEAL